MSQINTNTIKGVGDNDDVVFKTNNTTRITIASGGDTLVTALSAPSVSAINTAKVWLNYNQTGPTVRSSFGVASVTDNAAGQFTVNFSTAFPNNDYVVAGLSNGNVVNANDTYNTYIFNETAMAVGSCKITSQHSDGTEQDNLIVTLIFFGN
mgnify:FL=1|tara:strand:- start:880 stop:1335 length:456 start_codon:yes stop_codon:yes gene_type:complete